MKGLEIKYYGGALPDTVSVADERILPTLGMRFQQIRSDNFSSTGTVTSTSMARGDHALRQSLAGALHRYDTPEIFNIDQGSQLTSEEFTEVLKTHDIRISMGGHSCYHNNIFVERFWRAVKYECVYTCILFDNDR